MTAAFTQLIDAINALPKARRVMAFSSANQFAIRTTRNTRGNHVFLIAMYHRDVNNPAHFRGFY